MEYTLDFRAVKGEDGIIEYDVWITSISCDDEYIGQFKNISEAHRTVEAMVDNGMLS